MKARRLFLSRWPHLPQKSPVRGSPQFWQESSLVDTASVMASIAVLGPRKDVNYCISYRTGRAEKLEQAGGNPGEVIKAWGASAPTLRWFGVDQTEGRNTQGAP